MQRTTFILLILFCAFLISGQKFMVKDIGRDTQPYRQTMKIDENGDTTFWDTCWSFEIIDGKIINQRDDHCLRPRKRNLPALCKRAKRRGVYG